MIRNHSSVKPKRLFSRNKFRFLPRKTENACQKISNTTTEKKYDINNLFIIIKINS